MKLIMKTLWQLLMKRKKYRELQESTRMMNSQRGDTEKITLVEEGKKIGINEVIKCNEFINNSLKPYVSNEMLLLKVKNRYWKHKSRGFKY